MALEIVQVGDPVLRAPARELSVAEVRGREVQQLIERMRETMRRAPGVGLAAPQVGVSVRLAVIEDRAEYQRGVASAELAARERAPVPFHVIVNPRLVPEPGDAAVFREGCLSVAGFVADVPRAAVVRVDALDARGEPVAITARGWYARILQHEIDHLDGTLYIDRMDTRTFARVAPRAG